jgi:hypothetical protein
MGWFDVLGRFSDVVGGRETEGDGGGKFTAGDLFARVLFATDRFTTVG